MMQLNPLSVQEAFQRSDLVPDDSRQLLGVVADVSSPEALNVWQAWMGPDGDVVGFAGFDGAVHDHGVACVAAAGDVGIVDQGNELVVGACFEVAVAFAEVDVDFYFGGDGRHVGGVCEMCCCVISVGTKSASSCRFQVWTNGSYDSCQINPDRRKYYSR